MTNHTCKCGRLIPEPRNSTIWSKECPSCSMKTALKKKSCKSECLSRFPKIRTNDKVHKSILSDKSVLMKKADTIFSKYIRLKHSVIIDGNAYCRDIITNKLYSIKNIDNGHFISRGYFSTRFNEDNCRPQNRSSNRFKGELDKDKFENNLILEIGQERVDYLKWMKNQPGENTSSFFMVIIEEYNQKFKELLKIKNIKNPWSK